MTRYHNCKMLDSDPSRALRTWHVSGTFARYMQSVTIYESEIVCRKKKHAHACMLPGIERFYQELPWNDASLKGLERWDGVANGTESTRVFKHQACFTSPHGSY